jgi:hypothetical protein
MPLSFGCCIQFPLGCSFQIYLPPRLIKILAIRQISEEINISNQIVMIFKFQKFAFNALMAGVSPHYAHAMHGGMQSTPKFRHIMLLGAVILIIEGILIVNFYTSSCGSGGGAASEALWWQVNHRENKKNPEDDDEFDPSSWMQLKPSSYSMVHKTKNCVMLSNHTRRDALVRVIAYQKDASFQLENLLVHYLQAVRYDEIVIVDNDGVDAKTKAIAEKYVNKGVHLWRCAGTIFEKGELWTQVINVYKNDSQFLLPVDVDELMAIRVGVEPGEPFTSNQNPLVWNRKALENELSKLPPSNGRPYKTLDAKPVPLDCHVVNNRQQQNVLIDISDRSSLSLTRHMGPLCKVETIYRPEKNATSSCFAKNFYRGDEFRFTDVGNHHGHISLKECQDKGVEATYVQSNFVLVHFQVTTFADWLTHALRLASDRGFNRLEKYECPPSHRLPYHSCPMFQDFKAMNFSIYEMRQMYRNRYCGVGSDWAFMSAANITARSCRV